MSTILMRAQIWQIAGFLGALLLVAAEVGFRIGRSSPDIELERAASGAIKTAIVGLSGLLLAFSYSLAGERFALRNETVLRESNALGTCWLRTDFLGDPARGKAREILRSMVDSRLDLFERGWDPVSYERIHKELAHESEDLWKVVSNEYVKSAEPLRLTLLVQAANEVIDSSGARAAAMANRVPLSLLGLLVLSMLVTMFMIGHWSGQANFREWLLWTAMVALSMLVFAVVLDLDRPARGSIIVSHKAFEELRDEMRP